MRSFASFINSSRGPKRSEEHTSELQSYTTLFRSKALVCRQLRARHRLGSRNTFQDSPRCGVLPLSSIPRADQRDRKSTRLNSSPTRRSSDLKHLCAASFVLAIDSVLEILSRIRRDAEFCLFHQFLARPKDHCFLGADRGAGRLLSLGQAFLAEFALYDLGIETFPAELRHVERAGNLAIAAPDAEFAVPADYACLCVFLQASKHAGGRASRIDAVHALLLPEGGIFPYRRLVKLNDGLGAIVEIAWRLVKRIAPVVQIGRVPC